MGWCHYSGLEMIPSLFGGIARCNYIVKRSVTCYSHIRSLKFVAFLALRDSNHKFLLRTVLFTLPSNQLIDNSLLLKNLMMNRGFTESVKQILVAAILTAHSEDRPHFTDIP